MEERIVEGDVSRLSSCPVGKLLTSDDQSVAGVAVFDKVSGTVFCSVAEFDDYVGARVLV